MKKRIDALKHIRSNDHLNSQNQVQQQTSKDSLIISLLKTQQATNKLLQSLMSGQQQMITTLQDSQAILNKVARIEGALYKKVNDGQSQNIFNQTMKSQNKSLKKGGYSTQCNFKSTARQKSQERSPQREQSILLKTGEMSQKVGRESFQNRTPEEFRDITIKIQLPETILNRNGLEFGEVEAALKSWIADLFTCLSKATFAGYFQRKKLTEEEAKIYFSRNLIFNIINLIKIARAHQVEVWKKQGRKIMGMFQLGSKKIIGFLKLKYPQKKKMLYDPEMEKLIETFDDSQNIDFDIIYNSGCSFSPKQGTWTQIKHFLNKLLKEIKSNYQAFTEEMLTIFTISKNKDKYVLKNLIGSKIDVNVPLFDDKEIGKPGIKIANSQMLRMIVKWIECIEKLFFKTGEFFEKRSGEAFKFKTSFERLSQEDEHRFKHIIHKQEVNIEDLKDNQKELLDRLIDDLPGFIRKYQEVFTYLPPAQYEVGLFTSIMTQGIHDAISQYLQQLIKKTLEISVDYNLVYFDVYDLLRAKCSGTKEEILKVYRNLQNSKYFKIVRVKNRMKTSNQDFLVNMKIKNSPIICELQLCVASEKNSESEKEDYLNHFNHFLYELERSRYGPICESVILCSSLSDTISYFSIDSLKQKGSVSRQSQEMLSSIKVQLTEVEEAKSTKKHRLSVLPFNIPIPQECSSSFPPETQTKQTKKKRYKLNVPNYTAQQNIYSFICHSCKIFVQSFKTFVDVIKSEAHNFSICGDCVLSSLPEEDRVKYLMGIEYSQYFEEVILKQVKTKKPEFICAIEKSYHKKVVFLRYIESGCTSKRYVNFNYKYSAKIDFNYQELEDCYLFVFRSEVKKNTIPLSVQLFEKSSNKLEQKKEKRPQFYLEEGGIPRVIKKQSNSPNSTQGQSIKRLPTDILLLAKDSIRKEEMILTSFSLESQREIRIVDIQPANFLKYYEETIKSSKKQKKLKELIQERKKNWFYKNKDLSEDDIEQLQQPSLDLIETLECPKSLFTRLPAKLFNIKEIFLNDNQILQIDLRALNFPLLEKIELMRNKLTRITGFDTCPQLVDLRLNSNCLKELDFRKVEWKWLQNLDIIDNPLEQILGLSSSDGNSSLKAPELKNLHICLQKGKELDMSGLRSDNIFDFICSGTKQKSLNIKYPSLKQAEKIKIQSLNKLPFDQLSFNSLIFLALHCVSIPCLVFAEDFQFQKLQSIHISNSSIQQIVVNSNLSSLKNLKVSKSCLETLQFREGLELGELNNINLSHNLLRQLDLSKVRKINKLEKLNLGYNLIQHITLQPSSLQKLRIISLDHNPNIFDILCDYMDYGFTDFTSLESIEFGYNMKKPESLFWFFNSIQRLHNTSSVDPSDSISTLVAQVLEIKDYSLVDSIINSAFKYDLEGAGNPHYQRYLDSCSKLIDVVNSRGGDITKFGTHLYSAAVTLME